MFFTQQSTKAQDLDNSHSSTIRQLLEGSHNFEESHNVNAHSPTIRQLLEDAHPLPIRQLLEPDESIPELSFGENDPDKGVNNQHTSLSTTQQDNLALPDDYNPILMLPEPALENIGEGFSIPKR